MPIKNFTAQLNIFDETFQFLYKNTGINGNLSEKKIQSKNVPIKRVLLFTFLIHQLDHKWFHENKTK